MAVFVEGKLQQSLRLERHLRDFFIPAEMVSACPTFHNLLKQVLLKVLAGEEMPTSWGAWLLALELGDG